MVFHLFFNSHISACGHYFVCYRTLFDSSACFFSVHRNIRLAYSTQDFLMRNLPTFYSVCQFGNSGFFSLFKAPILSLPPPLPLPEPLPPILASPSYSLIIWLNPSNVPVKFFRAFAIPQNLTGFKPCQCRPNAFSNSA